MNIYDICLLHAQSDRTLRGAIASRLGETKITMMEWLLLGVVAQGASKGVAMSDIANQLNVTLPQVTALVNKLLPLKLIKQKSASNDRRSRLVTLSAKGDAVLREVNDTLENAKFELLGGSSLDEINHYTVVMKNIVDK